MKFPTGPSLDGPVFFYLQNIASFELLLAFDQNAYKLNNVEAKKDGFGDGWICAIIFSQSIIARMWMKTWDKQDKRSLRFR